ncbi:PREDICTED: dynein light chain 1, axonemal isoform X1 [Cercocebus atys]|nr:PREDICTED: dynein light chain 1, axonemal isoform X1 [Cercocebus atys]
MAKATTIKEALARWEEKTGQRPSEAKEIKLYAQIPPIEKMDASLSMLANCEKLSLSTNCIEKIANLNGLKNLRILSLGRNNIKNLNGLEAVGDTLEELWISYNFIEKLKGIHVMKKLKILYMSNNLVKDWAEFVKLAELPCLEDLVFVGNPLEEKHSAENNWIEEATKRVPKLKKLDEPGSSRAWRQHEPRRRAVDCLSGNQPDVWSRSRHSLVPAFEELKSLG